MRKYCLAHLFLLPAFAALAACNGSPNKIGSSIKGERIAVLEATQTLDATKNAADEKPSLPNEIVNFSWPQAGYDSEHALPSVQAPQNPKVLWQTTIGEGSNSDLKLLSHPVLSRGVVFTMDAEGSVSATDAESGARLWFRETTPKDSEGPAIGGGLAVDGNTIFATTGFGDVYALAVKTGDVLWHKSLQKPLRAAPTVADKRVFVLSIDNDLKALSADTGEILWQHSGTAENASLMGASSPAVQGDTVIAAYNTGEIYGLRAQNGRASWSYLLAAPAQIGALPAIADIRGLPVIDNDRVFAVSHSGRIAAIDFRSGDRAWENDIGGIDTPVVAGDAVFVYGGEGRLIAMTRNAGRILWSVQLPKFVDQNDKDSDPLIWTGPILAGGRLWMVNSKGKLASFSPDNGKTLSSVDLENPVYLSPIVVNSTFYVVTDNGKLIALR